MQLQIGHQYVKQRKEFGRHPLFNDGGAVVCRPLPCATCANWSSHGHKHGHCGHPMARRPRPSALLQMLADIRPNEEHMRNFVVRNPMSSAVQVGATMSEHEVHPRCQLCVGSTTPGALASNIHGSKGSPPLQVNTTAVVLVNKAMCHLEGGWPKEVDCTEVEQVIRYRRKAGAPWLPATRSTWLRLPQRRLCAGSASPTQAVG